MLLLYLSVFSFVLLPPQVNDLPWASRLSGGVTTVNEEISTGGVVVNQVMLHLAVADLPFGGVGASGTGRYHGHWGFETFSNPKAVLRKPSRPDPRLIYPPYGKAIQKLIYKLFIR